MKKILAVLFAGLFLFSSASAASMEFTVGSAAMLVEKEGKTEEKVLEAAPFINAESRTMVPVRAISEAFGAEVGWDETTRTVTVQKEGVEIRLVIDKKEAAVNGETKVLDTCPVIVEGRTMVPLRFIGEAFACNVQYASVTKQIVIDDTEPVLVCGDNKVCFAEFKAMYDVFYIGNIENAINAQMDETAYGQLVAQITLQSAENMLWMLTAFPSAALSPEECAEILGTIEGEGAILPCAKGYFSLLYEKNTIAGGAPILRMIRETADVEAYYKANYVQAQHVLVADIETANMVYAEAVGGADFGTLVKTYGMDAGMDKNPDGYIFTKGEMVQEFEEATFAAEVGGITKPVKSDYGYHIIKRLPLQALTEENADSVATHIANQKVGETETPKMVMDVETIYEKLGVSTKTAE